jgi:hypothetical protein
MEYFDGFYNITNFIVMLSLFLFKDNSTYMIKLNNRID